VEWISNNEENLDLVNYFSMSSPYQDFVRKAKARFLEKKQEKLSHQNGYEFTSHSRYKMTQYGLSEQKIKNVIRNPKRREVGIVPRTVAVMQPVSLKKVEGKEAWKQEIWVMFILKKKQSAMSKLIPVQNIRIISAWRYPGVSPKRNPIPLEILREIESEEIFEEADLF